MSPSTVAHAQVPRGRRVVNLLLRLLPIVLAGYALFDRTFHLIREEVSKSLEQQAAVAAL